MKIKFRESGNIAILDLIGKLTGTPMNSRVYEAVMQLIELGKHNVVLNLTDATHMDALGVGDLVSCKVQVMKESGDLKLAAASKKLSDFIAKAGLNNYFEIFEEETEAIKSFKQVDKNTE
jgi:anti-anti-sigma factor